MKKLISPLKKVSFILSILALIFTFNTTRTDAAETDGEVEKNYSLEFDQDNYTVGTLTANGKTIQYRAYEKIVYVSNPVDTEYQVMNLYIPQAYFESQSINGYTANTAPIFFPNLVGGYMPAQPADVTRESVSFALQQGYVVASPGVRGRTLQQGEVYTGKAPAAIVHLKAAVRYLRHNDKVIPGSTEKIIANGTSAGGALASLLGATGNHSDYEPFLQELGAANERDDIFAVSAYCPITNLENADAAYEWLFNGINTYRWREEGTLTPEQIQISNELKNLFPSYLNSLNLKAMSIQNNKVDTLKEGTNLRLNSKGEGSFKDYVKSFVIESAQTALDQGNDLSEFKWITVKFGQVTNIDFNKYLEYATRMKTPPAFDSLDASSWENSLFGTQSIDSLHFSQYSYENSTAQAPLAAKKIIEMMNPMNYIGTEGTNTSQYWRIRHGAIDRDTSLAIPVILATTLQNKGYDVDFALPWGVGHSGDYDLEELFTWIDTISKK